MAQQRFRRHHDQRLAQVAHHLPAQHVEHLRRRGRHADLHVVERAQLQEALQARRGVLGALAFVAVRQEQREPAQAAPLGFARGNELVDHDLGAVAEVAELRLPDHQRVRVGGGVAVLEGHHRLFRQQRVVDRGVVRILRPAAAAAARPRRCSGRAAPRGGGRRCRGRNPGRRCAAGSHRPAAWRRRGSRRSPSPSPARRPPSCGGPRRSWPRAGAGVMPGGTALIFAASASSTACATAVGLVSRALASRWRRPVDRGHQSDCSTRSAAMRPESSCWR